MVRMAFMYVFVSEPSCYKGCYEYGYPYEHHYSAPSQMSFPVTMAVSFPAAVPMCPATVRVSVMAVYVHVVIGMYFEDIIFRQSVCLCRVYVFVSENPVPEKIRHYSADDRQYEKENEDEHRFLREHGQHHERFIPA